MKRYNPSPEERERVRSFERALGISPATTGNNDTYRTWTGEPGITGWSALWQADSGRWFAALRDRPNRTARDRGLAGVEQAVLDWFPEAAPASPETLAGTLAGVPFLVKDLFDVRGERTQCGAALFGRGGGDGHPTGELAPVATDDAAEVARLRAAGAVPVGRTAMNEFAYGIDGRNAWTGDCPHPRDPRRISGGSSSGSAWAVAAGLVPLALGSDTGGSIRVPAALCGVYGYRHPWSQERLKGVFPLSAELDTVGWFVATAEDAGVLLDSAGRGPEGPETPLPDPIAGLRIAWLVPPGATLSPDADAALERVRGALQAAGARVFTPTPPELLGEAACTAYHVLGSSGAWEAHRETLDQYRSFYSPTVWNLIDRGRHWSRERRDAALETREELRRVMDTLQGEYDLVLIPSVCAPTPTFAEADGAFREQLLRLNAPVSLAGLGALALPLQLDAGRSAGVHACVGRGGPDASLRRILRWWGRTLGPDAPPGAPR